MSELSNLLGSVDRDLIKWRFIVKLYEMKSVFGSEYTKNLMEKILSEESPFPRNEKDFINEEKPANPYISRVPADSVCVNCLGTIDDYCFYCNRMIEERVY